ncbi:adenylosuccinate synthetase, partial [Staphylococcus hominis]|uniref:adenylosuccinate synthetase n=1 Tax=Staphylococcus hominis TaxID=1290 RepID=UPI0037099348
MRTTKKPIPPPYVHKPQPIPIPIPHLLQKHTFQTPLKQNIHIKNPYFKPIFNQTSPHFHQIFDEYYPPPQPLKQFLTHTPKIFHDPFLPHQNLLFQPPQPLILHIHHPTYPFLTSTNPLPPNLTLPTPLPPTFLSKLIRLSKSYTSPLPHPPFPTQLFHQHPHHIREVRRQYPTTTARPPPLP